MCNRNINGGVDNPLIKIQNWTLDEFKQIMSLQVLGQIRSYYFCGNFGDPILNNDLIEMCKYSKEVAPDVEVSIHTNGGARSNEWWQNLSKALPNDHNVVFALDGLIDTHHLYRIGTKFETVIEHAKAFIDAGGTAEWVFIKFKHNEHQIEKAEQMSRELGFKKFTVKNSSRFLLEAKVKVIDRNGKPSHHIEPASDTPLKFIDKKIIDSYKKITKNSLIQCKVKETKEIYIDAYKNIYPCCWIASVPYSYIPDDDSSEVRKEMLRQHYELIEELGNTNTIDRTIKEIINSNNYQTVWDKFWSINKLITCARTCGVNNVKFAQPKDQIVPL
jgi:MoaA/NifB/PqqE/SkfB family radical SAM enzyme